MLFYVSLFFLTNIEQRTVFLNFYNKRAGVVVKHADPRQARRKVPWVPGSNPGGDFIGDKVLGALVTETGWYLTDM